MATAETAGVRRLVSAIASSRATGSRVVGSNRTYTPWIRGMPCAPLSGATVESFTPTPAELADGMSSSSPRGTSMMDRCGEWPGATPVARAASSSETASAIGTSSSMVVASR